MAAIFNSPSKYIQGPDELAKLGSYVEPLGAKALVIVTPSGKKRVGAKMEGGFAEAKAELGTLTQEDIDLAIKPLRDRAGVANLSLTKANASPDPYLASPETGYANVTGDNKGVILEIRRERTVELLMENLRYWDIMRWKEGKRFEKPFKGLYFPGTGSYDLNGDGVDDVCIWSGSKPATSAATVYELNKEIFLSEGDRGNIVIHTDYVRTWDEERDYLYPVPTDDRVLTQGAITQNPGWKDGLNF